MSELDKLELTDPDAHVSELEAEIEALTAERDALKERVAELEGIFDKADRWFTIDQEDESSSRLEYIFEDATARLHDNIYDDDYDPVLWIDEHRSFDAGGFWICPTDDQQGYRRMTKDEEQAMYADKPHDAALKDGAAGMADRWINYIQLDDDGYPDEEKLEALAAEPMDARKSACLLLDLAMQPYPVVYATSVEDGTDCGRAVKVVSLSTGGWSGAESTLGVVLARADVKLFHWESSRRGGHYTFHIDPFLLQEQQ